MNIVENKKIVIAYAYGPKNSGDLAINLGAIDLLSEIIPEKNISMISRFAFQLPDFKNTQTYLKNYYPDVELLPGFFNYDRHRHNKIKKIKEIINGISKEFYYNILPFTNCNWPCSKTIKTICDSDFIFCNGGNLFYWNEYSRDLTRLFGLIFPFKFARKIGKNFGFLPQSFGKTSRLGKFYLSPFFRAANFITFRESISKNIFIDSFGYGKNFPVFNDLALYIKKIEKNKGGKILREKKLKNKKYIALTIRTEKLGDTESLEKESLLKITEFFTKLIKELLDSFDFKILLVCQTKADTESTLNIYKKFKKNNKVVLINEYDPLILKYIYKESLLLIAMRFHSAIFALQTGVPTLGIYKKEWGPKMLGTLSDLGLKNFCFEFSETRILDIIKQIQRIIANREKISKRILFSLEHQKKGLVEFIKKEVFT